MSEQPETSIIFRGTLVIEDCGGGISLGPGVHFEADELVMRNVGSVGIRSIDAHDPNDPILPNIEDELSRVIGLLPVQDRAYWGRIAALSLDGTQRVLNPIRIARFLRAMIAVNATYAKSKRIPFRSVHPQR